MTRNKECRDYVARKINGRLDEAIAEMTKQQALAMRVKLDSGITSIRELLKDTLEPGITADLEAEFTKGHRN